MTDEKKVQIIMIDTVNLVGSVDTNDESDPIYFEQPHLEGHSTLELQASTLNFLQSSIEASTADYLFVSGHYPVYSPCSHGPTWQLKKQIQPLLEKHGVHYISGHDHCMS